MHWPGLRGEPLTPGPVQANRAAESQRRRRRQRPAVGGRIRIDLVERGTESGFLFLRDFSVDGLRVGRTPDSYQRPAGWRIAVPVTPGKLRSARQFIGGYNDPLDKKHTSLVLYEWRHSF